MKPAVMIYVATAGLALASLAPAIAQNANYDPNRDYTRSVTVDGLPGGNKTVIVEDQSLPNRDITARTGALPEDTPIALAGRVLGKEGPDLIIDRPDGQVRARIIEPSQEMSRHYTTDLAGKVRSGDSVVIYGRMRHVPEDLTEVETEAVFDQTANKTYLTALGDDRVRRTAVSGPVTLHYHAM